jgi:DNA-binding transcriptional MerR regulator
MAMSMAEDQPIPVDPTGGGGAGERNHISIGEVLSLLQDEFPDVTISKIRFLESQGLLNPERTPSGYRKFYDADVEQLRWVLRQQRENFLPLKVIKDRLAAGRLDATPDESGILAFGAAGDPAPSAARAEVPPHGSTPAKAAPTQAAPASVASSPSASESQSSAPSAGAASGATDPESTAGEARGVSSTGGSSGGGGRPPVGEPRRARATGRSEDAGGSQATPGADAIAGGSGGRSVRSGRGQGEDPLGLSSGDSGVSMTAAELCGAAGLTFRQLAELERFGLVKPLSSGTDAVYDEDALVAARLASALGGHGVEPRHLRMFRLQADREAALYEQLTVPRLMAHRAEAREEALADLARIAGLADELRAALLRSVLRDSLRHR